MSGKITPLYIVCSSRPCGGKTLVSRLLTEFYALGEQPVAAFDLADEGPQLADYLPQYTTIADINDIRGQMAFFERVIENEGAKIIDVSHRTLQRFFKIVHEISLFEEARHHFIEPLILFIIDADAKSSETYGTIRRRFTQASLLPVRNMAETIGTSTCGTPKAFTAPASLDVPLLSFSLRALVDRQHFSFSEFWRAQPENLPDSLDDKLRDWAKCVFFQLGGLERVLGCEGPATWIAAPPSRLSRKIAPQGRPQPVGAHLARDAESAAITQHALDVTEEILKFAPKKIRGDAPSHPSAMLQMVSRQLQSAEDRIGQLEAEIKQWRGRAVWAETRLY